MGLVFKNIKQLQANKVNSCSRGLQSKVSKRKPKNIKLTHKSKQILKHLGFQLKQNA